MNLEMLKCQRDFKKKLLCVIIDSGISYKKSCNDDVVGGIELRIDDNRIVSSPCFFDDTGHGTACYDIIRNITPYAKFYIIKISVDNISNIILLEEALKFCAAIDCNIINISMAVEGTEYLREFAKANKCLRKLRKQNKLVVAAKPNHSAEGFPSNNKNVISVPGSNTSNMRSISKIPIRISRTPQFTSRDNKDFFLFGGNSKATAQVTGHIINRLVENEVPGCTAWKFVTDNYVCIEQRDGTDASGDIPKKEALSKDNSLYCQLIAIIAARSNYSTKEISVSKNLMDNGIINKNNLVYIIDDLEKTFHLSLIDNNLRFEDFKTVAKIAEMIEALRVTAW